MAKTSTRPLKAVSAAALTIVAAPAAASAVALLAAAPAVSATPPASLLSKETQAALRADGGAAYEGEQALREFARIFRALMATATQAGDFVAYSEAARQWKIGYEQTKRNTTDEAVPLSDRAQTAFDTRVKQAKSEELMGDDRLIGDKPKSQDAAAINKAAARAAATAALAKAAGSSSLVELGKTAAQAAKKAQEEQDKLNKLRAKSAELKDEAKKAEAIAQMEELRLKAKVLEDQAAQAKKVAEFQKAKVEKEEADKSAKKMAEFKAKARELIANAPLAELIRVVNMLEAAGVKTAEQKKAEATAPAKVS